MKPSPFLCPALTAVISLAASVVIKLEGPGNVMASLVQDIADPLT